MRASMVIAVIGMFALGCAPTSSTTEVRFAIPSPATGPGVRLGEAIVLTTRVNLQEPIIVAVSGRDVTVTAAAQGHRGWTYGLDPLTHAAPSLTPFDYPDHPASRHPGQREDADHVRLHDDRMLRVWTDAPAGRVLAQIFDPDGTAHGPEITVSGDAEAVGAPHVVTADGHHAVITYVTSNEAGFSLMARAVEAP